MSQEQETIRFGDLYLTPSRNGVSKPKRVRGEGYPMVNMGELFKYDRISDETPMELVPLTETEKANSFLETNDLLFARQSLVAEGAGKCSQFIGESEETTFESHLIRVRIDPKKADPRFYYYYFNSPEGKAKTQSLVMQVAAAGIRGSELKELSIAYPEKSNQEKISKVLAEYDDLIENNQKRVKILEEMAQAIYTEWFVNYGDKIPDGWKVTPIGDQIKIPKGKNITKKTLREGGVPVVAGGLKPAYHHAESNTQNPVVTISASGANSGFVNLYLEDVWASDCSYIDLSVTPHVYFYYLMLKSRQHEVTHLQRGSAQPHVYPKDIMGLEMVVPAEDKVSKFCELVTPIFYLIRNLRLQINNLTETRDLLIPKLITGEIEIKT